MTFRITVIFIVLNGLVFFGAASGQKKWIGGNPGGWANLLNWQPAGVPASADDVIIDNTYQHANYTLSLPDIAVSIHSLSVAPDQGVMIDLVLPSSNKVSPALVIASTGNSLVLERGGTFRNSSGLSSGQAIQLAGSICIYNGGSYIHNSRSVHATDLVAKLAAFPGTEKGIFEFDVPGGSYPISLSNRTFGTLVLSAAASGGTQTYNASGSNRLTINGDLLINDGVQFNADFTNEIIINGNYDQNGGVFNLASQPNNNLVKIKGNIRQAPAALITETSGGQPGIEISGNRLQQLSIAGSITHRVVFRMNNPAGASLLNPLVIPFRLELVAGVLKTSAINMITMPDTCVLVGGSNSSYIEGPLRRIGNTDLEFPIGKQHDYAPLKIIRQPGSETDEFIAEYFLDNPGNVYGRSIENPPIVRISALEYWTIKRLVGSSTCKVMVSVGTYSSATALDKLVVARWDAPTSRWKNGGNTAYSGISTGTITSAGNQGAGAFTLASTVEMQNPLPLKNPSSIHYSEIIPSPADKDCCKSLKLAANPVRSVLRLVLPVRGDLSARFVISDLSGRQLQTAALSLPAGTHEFIIPVHDLPGGAYLVRLYDRKGLVGSVGFLKL